MYPQAFISYLVHFHCDRDYFECHEVLEEYWKEIDQQQHNHWIGFIQLAVSLYHHRRNNFSGAEKLMKKAIFNLKNEEKEITQLGLDFNRCLSLMQCRLMDIHLSNPYSSMNLPFKNQQLFQICQEECQHLNLIWGSKSNLSDMDLIHKHMLRDRSSIIKTRAQKIIKKRTDQNKTIK